MAKGELSMVAYVYELSAAELAQVEGGDYLKIMMNDGLIS